MVFSVVMYSIKNTNRSMYNNYYTILKSYIISKGLSFHGSILSLSLLQQSDFYTILVAI